MKIIFSDGGSQGFRDLKKSLWRILQRLSCFGEAGADLVVLSPHHPGGTGEVVPLQVGEELVFLSRVMNDDLGQVFQGGSRGLGRAYAPGPGPGRGDEGKGLFPGLPVFFDHGMDGVSGQFLRFLAQREGLLKYLDMNLAESLHLFNGHAPVDEGLLHGGHLGGAHPLDESGEFLFELARRFSAVEPGDDFLKFHLPGWIDNRRVGHENLP